MADFGDEVVHLGPGRQRRGSTSANTSAKVIAASLKRQTTYSDEEAVTRHEISKLELTVGQRESGSPPQDHHNAPGPRRRRRYTMLARKLKERHINMIAFSSVVGVGLYLQNGRVIYLAGPGMAFLIYPIGVAIVWATMGSLGEMTALYPVPGALFELPARFLDQSMGYAAGWMSWFACVVINAAELDAVAGLFNFSFDPAYLREVNYPSPTLEWPTSSSRYSPAIWVASFWILSLAINLLPIRVYGEIEYIIGVFKMCFFVGLIIFQLILNLETGTGDRFYRNPYSFVTHSFTTWQEETYTSAGWRFAGVWTGFVVLIYSLLGFESVSITAAENEEFGARRPKFVRREGIKISTRKIGIRILTLYTFATLLVGFNVPDDDPNITNPSIQALGGGQHSAFIIAAVRARKTFWPGFINGVFILSATSASINSLYMSSRLLHALALARPVWPEFRWASRLRGWLEEVGGPGLFEGVPRHAVFVSSLFGWLGLLVCSNGPAVNLGRLAVNSSVSMLIVYFVVCWTYVRFREIISRAAGGSFEYFLDEDDVNNPPNPEAFNRDAWTYPYRSSEQSGRARMAACACAITVIFNGWRSIYPFVARDFLASYVSAMIFVAITIAYRVRFCGWRDALNYKIGLKPAIDIREPIMVERSEERPGRDQLQIDKENLMSKSNLYEVMRWLRTWME